MQELIKILEIPPAKVDTVIKSIRSEAGKKYHKVNPFPEIPDVIHSLATNHKLIILSSNSRETIESFLENHELTGLFSGTYVVEGLFDKHIAISNIAEELNIPKDQIVFIGDEARDIEAAHTAGVTAIGANWWGYDSPQNIQHAQPDFICQRPKDLLTAAGS